MGRPAPCAYAQIPVEAERTGGSKRREERYGLQERRVLRSEAFGVFGKEEDDYPGTEEPHGQ